MNIQRQNLQLGQITIPSVVITPSDFSGAAVVIHGYGGCKEEQLGLALRIAENGLKTITIDLRGHGENPLPLDEGIVSDLEAVIEYGRQFGKITVIGHSLGGRLALLSKADYVIGISPALNQHYSEATRKTINNFRGHRVNCKSPKINFEIIEKLPVCKPDNEKSLILYGVRDVPEIIKACNEFKNQGVKVIEIDKTLHGDIFLNEKVFNEIGKQIRQWYK